MARFTARAALLPLTLAASVALAGCAQGNSAGGDDDAVSFDGETIRIIVGTSAGGAFDQYARTLARYMASHIEGEPTLVVENVEGAGGMVAANTLFNTSPTDGTAIGTFNESLLINQLAGVEGVEFDLREFTWIGSITTGPTACVVRADSGVTSLEDALGPNGAEVIIGAQNPGSASFNAPAVIKEALGANFNIVRGYPGNAEIRLAVESGEVDGYCGGWDAVEPWVADREATGDFDVNILVQLAANPVDDMGDVPLARDIAPNDDARALIEMITAPQNMRAVFTLPPGVPDEIAAELRSAFEATMSDPGFQAELEQQQLPLDPHTAAEVAETVAGALNAPEALKEQLAAVIGVE